MINYFVKHQDIVLTTSTHAQHKHSMRPDVKSLIQLKYLVIAHAKRQNQNTY